MFFGGLLGLLSCHRVPDQHAALTEDVAYKIRQQEQWLPMGAVQTDSLPMQIGWEHYLVGEGYFIVLGTMANTQEWIRARAHASISNPIGELGDNFFGSNKGQYYYAERFKPETDGPIYAVALLMGEDSLSIAQAFRSSFLRKQMADY